MIFVVLIIFSKDNNNNNNGSDVRNEIKLKLLNINYDYLQNCKDQFIKNIKKCLQY